MRFRLRLFVAEEYKPLRLVPPLMWPLTIGALLAQIAFALQLPPPEVRQRDYTTPPQEAFWRVAALGEPETLAKVAVLNLQAFDNQPGVSVPFSELDYEKLGLWLDRIVALDERAEYPHFLMSKVYSLVNHDERRELAARWVWRQFLRRPDERWWWMAHIVSYAKHILGNDELALQMAHDLRTQLTPGATPSWPRQMEAYLLESLDEFDTAATILFNQLEAGEITDPQEFTFLIGRLEGIIIEMRAQQKFNSREEFEAKINQVKILEDKFLEQFSDILK